LIQEVNQRVTREWSCLPNQQREPEPTRVGIRSCLGQDEVLLRVFESRLQIRKISLSCLNECRQLLQLRDSHGSLHVSGFEIIAHMRIDVFVIVAVRQLTELPVKTLAAGVLLAGGTPTIPAPVAKGFDERAQEGLFRQDASAFAHGDVVRGIKAYSREIAEGSDFLSAVGRAERVTAIFDQPQAVLLRERGHGIEIERVPQRVRKEDGTRAVG